MLVFYASSASSIPKAQSRAESVFLQLKSIHPSKGRNPKAEKSREKDGTCGLASFDRDARGKRNLGRQKPVPPRTAKSGPKPQDVWTRRLLRVRCLSPKARLKGARRECLFAFFFCDDFFGAFFLHLILILIDPDFNEQQQKTTEEKTL